MARLYYVRRFKLAFGPELPIGEWTDESLPLPKGAKMESSITVENGRISYLYSIAEDELVESEVENDTTE